MKGRKIKVICKDGSEQYYSNVDYVTLIGELLRIYIFNRFMPVTIEHVTSYSYMN